MFNFNDVRDNKDKGFSLVELIVVIAIMAVMVAVLAPSLLSYVEKSRAQKDDSAMGEVTNAIQLALADEKTFNEVLKYSCYGNVSCYVDTKTTAAQKVITRAANKSGKLVDQFTYDDNARINDEERYLADGNMRGVTITFSPTEHEGSTYYNIGEGKVNYFVGGDTTVEIAKTRTNVDPVKFKENLTPKNPAVKDMEANTRTPHLLQNKIEAAVGQKIELSSQTYRNSDYTVFIRMGSTGGNAAAADSIAVYGQWNGTNLADSAVPAAPTPDATAPTTGGGGA